ncbi:MAG TPA: hypothetical protein VIF62_16355 [Labilithrix sp.]|jgi:hypothetical protein
MSAVARITREIYKRELLPARALWWLAAAGMRDWYRVLAKRLTPYLVPSSRSALSELSVRMFERRWDARAEAVRARGRRLPERSPRDVALLMSALYRVERAPKASWIFEALGGPPRGIRERARARRLLGRLDAAERWNEVASHLGELLIVLTEDLPARMPHARKILGDICFDAGAKYAERVKRAFAIPDRPADPPTAAMEILRMSEWVFQVNPEHWSASDGESGYLEGTACPWYPRPGWNGGHCGIFGQFQSGIASTFGLRYHLSKTIPKHGGHTCRIDVKPIALRLQKT